ncbi:MAG: NnrU family protein [Pseudomonadota bacterium]
MAGGWGEFGLAYLVFLLTHAVPTQTSLKPRLTKALGRPAYGALYGLVSVAALAWLIVAAGRAPFMPILGFASWQMATPFVLMVPACLLVTFALGRPNPYSFGGVRNERYNPAYPGVVRFTRHPLLAAIALWSLSHALANGDLAHLLLFGGFFAFSLLGMVMINRRHRGAPWQPSLTPVERMSASAIALRTALGLAVYAGAMIVHPWIAGVDILPLGHSLLARFGA